MGKIDTCTWKEFKVGDLFTAERGQSFKMLLLEDGNTPVIAAARYNQGIAGYYNVEAMFQDSITISCNGVGCGSTFYHDYPFAITGDAIVLLEKQHMPDKAKRFIAAVYDKYFNSKYSYEEKCSAGKAEAEIILLPATPSGQPDFTYMENYMKKIETSVSSALTKLQSAQEGSKKKIKTDGWGEFRIGDLFEMSLSSDDIQAKDFIEGNIPLISSGKTNNGVVAYIQDGNAKLQEAGTITVDMFGAVFYQDQQYYCESHGRVNILTPYYYISDKVGLYLASAIGRVTNEKYEFNEMCTGKKLANDIIRLPITPTGEPDWNYMEDCMRKMEEKAKREIDVLKRA